ncbi:hypothetical protein LCGC14_2133450, partial [marine sediment metagenome]
MFKRFPYAVAVLGCAVVLMGGCQVAEDLGLGGPATAQPVRAPVPSGIAGTVSEYAHLVGYDVIVVRGYGLVVGLGTTGSAEAPPALRKYLGEQMRKHKLASPMAGTGMLTPGRMLADMDTAVVVLRGLIPAAAPRGTRFDLYVEALPSTQTTSLDGGMLMTAELHLGVGGSIGAISRTKSWAMGRGAIFVNPFPGTGKTERRAGRIPNGGVITRKQPIRLELRRSDFRT